jgi:hypothetical protein
VLINVVISLKIVTNAFGNSVYSNMEHTQVFYESITAKVLKKLNYIYNIIRKLQKTNFIKINPLLRKDTYTANLNEWVKYSISGENPTMNF